MKEKYLELAVDLCDKKDYEIVTYFDQTLIYIPEQLTPAKPLHK